MSKRRSKRVSTLGARLTSMVSVALVLVLIGAASLVGIAGMRMHDQIKHNIGFVAVMDRDCTPDQINAMKTCLLSQKAVKSFTYSSADEILATESEFMGQDIAEIADGNPYSPEFDVKVRPEYSATDSIAHITALVADMPGVSEVTSESAVIEGINATMHRVTLVLTGLALVLLMVSVALIGNTVSLSIYGRRFIIHTMKLVGATPGFIRRPFVFAGLRDGFIAGLMASAVIAGIRYYAPTLDAMAGELAPWTEIAWICGTLTLAGAMITSITALMAANRYLKASYDEMFLK